MDLKVFTRTLTRKATVGLVFALALSLLSVSVAFAVLQAIDTTNNSDSDWASVPVFQTDPSGDLVDSACSSTYGDQDDIIETFVATGPSDPPTHIWFGVRTAAANAVSDQYHQVAAYVDCGPGGAPPDGPDVNDVVIMYRGQADHVIYGDGGWGLDEVEHPTPYYINTFQYDAPGDEGERPGNAPDRVEWGMPMVDFDVLSSTPLEPPYDPNCGPGSEARVIFFSYKVNSDTSFDCTYDETVFAGFNIPTLVELNSLSAQSTSGGVDKLTVSAAALLGAFAVGGLGILLLRKRNHPA